MGQYCKPRVKKEIDLEYGINENTTVDSYVEHEEDGNIFFINRVEQEGEEIILSSTRLRICPYCGKEGNWLDYECMYFKI
jgi:hypothetical protein